MTRWTPRPRRPRRDGARGQSMVEFAIILPLMILILVGIVDFGNALHARMTVINAAREGARYGVTHAETWTPTYNCGQITSRVPTEIRARNSMLTPGNSTITIAHPTGCDAGDDLTVTVRYTYNPLFPFWFGPGINVAHTVQMKIE